MHSIAKTSDSHFTLSRVMVNTMWSSSGSIVKKRTRYFSKNYLTNFANYMISQLSDMARESSEFTYQIR